MLHRPQSIFLVITIIGLCLVALMPTWHKEAREPDLQLVRESHLDSSFFSVCAHGGSPVAIMPLPFALLVRSLNLIAVFIAIYGLVRYDSRVYQLKLGLLNTFVLAILLGLALYLSIQRQKETWLLIDCRLLAVALVSNLLANRYIRKDAKSIKDADRIR